MKVSVVHPSVVRHLSTNSNHISSETENPILFILYIWHLQVGGKNNCVFRSGRIRALVAIATYSSHRLIMGKEEIDIFFCLIGDILNFFL